MGERWPALANEPSVSAGRIGRWLQGVAWWVVDWLTLLPLTDRVEWWIEALSRFAATGMTEPQASARGTLLEPFAPQHREVWLEQLRQRLSSVHRRIQRNPIDESSWLAIVNHLRGAVGAAERITIAMQHDCELGRGLRAPNERRFS